VRSGENKGHTDLFPHAALAELASAFPLHDPTTDAVPVGSLYVRPGASAGPVLLPPGTPPQTPRPKLAAQLQTVRAAAASCTLRDWFIGRVGSTANGNTSGTGAGRPRRRAQAERGHPRWVGMAQRAAPGKPS
jgi:hypothetical protein